ncbi:MAG: hypothetical protein E7389_01860 [Ruminococcaceae bacterium]|nr:hypothetical protein [Oscillospiraceae bacterium]
MTKVNSISKLVLVLVLAVMIFNGAVNVSAAYTVYSQKDGRWGSHPYGYKDTAGTQPTDIANGGCGILALVNAVSYMNGNFISPTALADFSVNNGYRINGVGTSMALYKAYSKSKGSNYGFECTSTSNSTKHEDIVKHIKSGNTVVASSTTLANSGGHIMAIVDYRSSDDKFLIFDSYISGNRFSTDYSWQTIGNDLKTGNGKVKFKVFVYIYNINKKPPAIPKVTSIEMTATNTVTIKWNKSEGAESYRVDRRVSGGTFSTVKSGITSTSYVDKSLKSNTLYWYRIYAVNSSSTCDKPSDLGIYTLPNAPKVGRTDSINTLNITWNGITGTGYYVLNGRKYSEDYSTVNSKIQGTSYKVSGLQPGTQYYYKIRAVSINGKVKSDWSEDISGYTLMSSPTISAISETELKVSWDALNGIEQYSYIVQRSADGVNFENIQTINGTSYKDTGLDSGKRYYYKIIGKNKLGTTITNSTISSGFTNKDNEKPIISNLKISDVSSRSFTIGCDLNDNVGVKEVWVHIFGQGAVPAFGVPASNGHFSYTIDTWKYYGQGTYLIHLYAYDSEGNSGYAGTYVFNAIDYDIVFPGNTEMYDGHIYQWYYVPGITWHGARMYAERLGGYLTSITSEEENEFINNRLTYGDNRSFFTGLNDIWDEGNFSNINGENSLYTNWSNGEPDNANTREDAVCVKSDGAWCDCNADTAYDNVGFIVEYEPKIETEFEYKGKYYQAFSVAPNKAIAKAYCESVGGHLATIKSSEIVDRLTPGKPYWFDYSTVKGNDKLYGFVCEFDMISAENIVINTETVKLANGEKYQLIAEILPEGAEIGTVWESLDNSIAEVTDTGLVTAISEGDTIIKVSDEAGIVSTYCKVTVVPFTDMKVTGIAIDSSELILEVDEIDIITAEVLPTNAENRCVNWKSDNTEIVAVDSDGYVYALKEGTAVITAETEDGEFSASCNITVIPSTFIDEERTTITVNFAGQSILFEEAHSLSGKIIVAIYDDNNRLKHIDTYDAAEEINAGFHFGKYAKIMWWDGFMPVCEAKIIS